MSLVGRVEEQNHWYRLSDSKIVSFHTAFTNKDRSKSVMFVSDNETWPSITAEKLGISYTYMRNSTPEEIADFLKDARIKVVPFVEESANAA